MNVITSRLPLGSAGRRMPGSLGRFGVLNWMLGAALVGAGIGAYFVVAGTSTPAAAVRTATVERGVVLSTTSATGTLQSAEELAVGFTSSGTVTAVSVKPGERVHRGQALGRVDSTSAQQSLQQAQASLATAQASYEQTLTGETAVQRRQDALSLQQSKQALANARTSAKQDAKTSAASIAQAKRALAIDLGQEKLDLYQLSKDKATYPTQAAASAAITADQAQLASDQAKQQADTQQNYTLQAQQTSDNNQLSADQANLTTAQNNHASAGVIASYTAAVAEDRANLATDASNSSAMTKTLGNDSYAITQDNAKVSSDQSALTALENDATKIRSDEGKIASDRQSVASAKLSAAGTTTRDAQSIASAKMSLQSTVASVAVKQAPPTPSALASAHASLVNAQIAVVNAQKTVDDTILRAPIAGTVAAVNGTVGTTESGGGSSAVSSSSSSGSGSGGSGSSSGFVTLTGITGMQLVAGFAETDTAKLRVGQAATVTVDALPTKELAAHVIAIAGTSTTSSSVVTYNVTFALDRTEPGLKPGMTANVDVVVGEADNVLHVPTAAVTGSGANASVTVLRAGKQVRVPVVAGLQGDSSTAILSGVKAGDNVVLPQVTISSSSTGSSTTGGGTLNFGGGAGGGRGRIFTGGFGG